MNALRIAGSQAWAGIRKRGSRSALIVIGIVFGIAFVACTRIEYQILVAKGITSEDSERFLWFSVVALFMTVIGVGNSMAISIAERIREIGTLKCLGASNRLVAGIYFLEAIAIGAIGSVLGGTIGAWIAFNSAKIGWSWTMISESILIGLSATVFSALIPAIAAARMRPADALRTDV